MRKLKFIIPVITAIVAIVVTLFVSAFTNKKVENKKKLATVYFVLVNQSDQTSASARVSPGSWTLANGNGTSRDCPGGITDICQIKAENNNGQPVIASGSALYNKLYNSGSSSIPSQDGVSLWTMEEDN